VNQNNCPTCRASIAENAPGGFCPACLLREASDEGSLGERSTPSLSEMASAFPDLEILELIGQGGMGFVYKARQGELDRIVALKILSPDLGSDPAFEERFAREARVLGKLQHPNVVSIYEQGKSGGYFYLMMEYVDGVNLRQAMAAGQFTPEQTLAMVPGICDALQAAHVQGVWHRDIKPENILLDQNGEVKIVDFGIARIVGDPQQNFTLTQTGGVLGSVAYMAPEQHESPRDIDHRADIYSLGVVIYEMLTGELPLGRFPNPSSRAEVNGLVDEIVLRTLEKERELRQQSVDEVKTDLVEASKRFFQEPQKIGKGEGGMSRFVMGGIALFLGGGVFSGLGVSVKSPFAIAIGGAICAVGFLGCLWSLWQMKIGARSTKGRALLIAIALLPLCAGVIGFAFGMIDMNSIFPRSKGGLFVGGGLMLVILTLLFWLAGFLGRPLSPPTPRRKWLGRLSFIMGICALIGGGLWTKQIDGKWPFVGNKAFLEIHFDPSLSPSVSELEVLARKAAGRYSDDYAIEVDSNVVTVTVYCRGSWAPMERMRYRSESEYHLGVFDGRFKALLPADRLPLRNRSAIRGISGRQAASRPRQVPMFLIAAGSFLVVLAGGRRMWWVMAGGLVSFGLLAALPVWKGGTGLDSFIDGPPLSPFGYEEMPPADFSTPEKAVMSFFDAASRDEIEVVKRGASRALRQILDEHNEWEVLSRRSGRQSAHSHGMDRFRGMVRVNVSDPVGRGMLYVVKEEGEWKVDDLNYTTDARGRTGPFSQSMSPAFALRELLEAAKNGDAKTFRARLSEALRAEIKAEEGGRPNFGDFGKVKFVEVSELRDEEAKILVETIDRPKRKLTFTMIQEDGQWKLSKNGF